MKVNTTLYLVAAALSFAIVALRASHEAWLRVYPVAHFTGVILRILPLPIFPPPSNAPWWVLKHRLKLSLLPSALFTPSSRPPPSAHKHPDMTAHHTLGAWWVGEKENSIGRRDTHTQTHTCADIQTQRKMSITFLWAIFYCWWTAIGFMASNHEWCSAFSLCFLLALYSLYISVSLSPIEISCSPSLLLPL